MSARKDIHPIAKVDPARGHDTHIDSPEVSVPQFLQPDQAQRVREPAIFLTTIVRRRRDFQQRLAHFQPASRRQIAGREIEIENQAISEQSEGLAIADQLRHALLHDGDLHLAIAALGAAPGVAGDAIIRLQDGCLKRLASAAFVPVATMPGWLQGFARNQPVSQVIGAARALVLGGPTAVSICVSSSNDRKRAGSPREVESITVTPVPLSLRAASLA